MHVHTNQDMLKFVVINQGTTHPMRLRSTLVRSFQITATDILSNPHIHDLPTWKCKLPFPVVSVTPENANHVPRMTPRVSLPHPPKFVVSVLFSPSVFVAGFIPRSIVMT